MNISPLPSVLDMFFAIPEGSYEEYAETLNTVTQWFISFDIIAAKHNKTAIRNIVTKTYLKHMERLAEEEFRKGTTFLCKDDTWLPWEEGSEERILGIRTSPHEFGSQIKQIQYRKEN